MKIWESGTMEKEFNFLYGLGLKDYEIIYLRLMRQKEINKRHWDS